MDAMEQLGSNYLLNMKKILIIIKKLLTPFADLTEAVGEALNKVYGELHGKRNNEN